MRRTRFTGAMTPELVRTVAREINLANLRDIAQRHEMLLVLQGKQICKEHGWYEKHECPDCHSLEEWMARLP